MAYQRTQCPGSGLWVAAIAPAGGRAPRGVCPCCGREYKLNDATVDGHQKMRRHKPLPVAADGGCPYRCPLDCDFDCYFPATI